MGVFFNIGINIFKQNSAYILYVDCSRCSAVLTLFKDNVMHSGLVAFVGVITRIGRSQSILT